jgi:hypothetical protein
MGGSDEEPPLTPDESEREALAVEVRVRWGDDLVHVVHLDPQRSFFIGGAGCDFAVDGEGSSACAPRSCSLVGLCQARSSRAAHHVPAIVAAAGIVLVAHPVPALGK